MARAIRKICDVRGSEWQAYQLNCKLKSPYARQRALSGIEGLIAFYDAYRRVPDALVHELGCDRISFDTSEGNWPAMYARVADGLSGVGVTF